MKTEWNDKTETWTISEVTDEEYLAIVKAAHVTMEAMRWEPERRVYYTPAAMERRIFSEKEVDTLLDVTFG